MAEGSRVVQAEPLRITEATYHFNHHYITGNSRDYFSDEDRQLCRQKSAKLSPSTHSSWLKQLKEYFAAENKLSFSKYVIFEFNERIELEMPLGFMDDFIKEMCETFSDFTFLIDCNGYSQNNFREFVKQKDELIAKFRVEKQVSEAVQSREAEQGREANQEKLGKITNEQAEALLEAMEEVYMESSQEQQRCIIC